MRLPRALVAAVVLGTAACGLPSDDVPRRIEGRGPAPASAGPELPAGARSTTLYLVRDAALAPVTRRTASTASVRTALQLLLRGPDEGESAQGLSSALGPEAVLVEEVERRGDGVTVPLAAASAGLGRSDEVLAYAQVVATLTALPGVVSVRFVRDGSPLPVPRADGSLADGPLTRRDYAALL